jgi:hypothetical protein
MAFFHTTGEKSGLAILVIATLTTDFKQMVVDYIDHRFGQAGRNTAE